MRLPFFRAQILDTDPGPRDTDAAYQPTHDEVIAALRDHLFALSYLELGRWWEDASDEDRDLAREAFDLDAALAAIRAVSGVVLDEARERRVA